MGWEEIYAAVFAGGEEGGEPLGSGGSAGYYSKLGMRGLRGGYLLALQVCSRGILEVEFEIAIWRRHQGRRVDFRRRWLAYLVR